MEILGASTLSHNKIYERVGKWWVHMLYFHENNTNVWKFWDLKPRHNENHKSVINLVSQSHENITNPLVLNFWVSGLIGMGFMQVLKIWHPLGCWDIKLASVGYFGFPIYVGYNHSLKKLTFQVCLDGNNASVEIEDEKHASVGNLGFLIQLIWK